MTEKTGIIYLQKDKFQLYSPYLSNILEFKFVPEISLDFDLFNKPVLENLLKTFIVNNKIPAGSLIIVIADNASFIKDFALTQTQPSTAVLTLDDLQNQANEFIDHVPFDEVAGRTYPLPNGIRAYATNKEMFEEIKSLLEKQGFIIEMVIPGFILGPEASSSPTLNINVINIITQKMNLVKEYNLLSANSLSKEAVSSNEPEEKENQPEEINIKEKKENKNLVLIIGISIIAIIFIITGFILYLQFTEKPYSNNPAVVLPSKPTSIVVVSPTIVTTQIKDLTVQIISASSSAATAEAVRSTLSSYGFKEIALQNQDILGTTQSLLIFSTKVNIQTKNSVTTEIRKFLGEVLIQEKTDTKTDITVILGK